MNNLYNSFSLTSKLILKNIYCNGTLRFDSKNNTPEVENVKVKIGDTIVHYGESVIICKGSGDMHLFKVSKWNGGVLDKRGNAQIKPFPIIKYNALMKVIYYYGYHILYYLHKRKFWGGTRRN